jgi:SRSO17 transposase
VVGVSDSLEGTTRIGLHSPPEFLEFLRPFANLFYRTEGRWAMNRYVVGLMAPIGRKNCEQIAAAVAGIKAQELQALLTDIPWDYTQMDHQRVNLLLSRAIVGDGVLIFDDTGIPKQGEASVGVARQYSGTLGKIGNCQISVTCRYADPSYTWPVAGRVYLPESWASDKERRAKAKVPEGVKFQTKVEIALALLDQARAWRIPHDAVTADSNYGDNPKFLAGLESRHEPYVVAVAKDFTVRLPAELARAREEAALTDQAGPATADGSTGEQTPGESATERVESADVGAGAKPKRRGRPPKPRRVLSPEERAPLHKACELTGVQPEENWQAITYREGTKGPITKEFLGLRACRAFKGNAAGEGAFTGVEGWLIGERPLPGHEGDPKWYYSDFPPEALLSRLAELAHRREPIERGYRLGKDGLGLDETEVRLWHGFHRHQALVMLAESWLVLQRQWREPATAPLPEAERKLALPTAQVAEATTPPGEPAPDNPNPTPAPPIPRPVLSPPDGVDWRDPTSGASTAERMVLHQLRPLAGRYQPDKAPTCPTA